MLDRLGILAFAVTSNRSRRPPATPTHDIATYSLNPAHCHLAPAPAAPESEPLHTRSTTSATAHAARQLRRRTTSLHAQLNPALGRLAPAPAAPEPEPLQTRPRNLSPRSRRMPAAPAHDIAACSAQPSQRSLGPGYRCAGTGTATDSAPQPQPPLTPYASYAVARHRCILAQPRQPPLGSGSRCAGVGTAAYSPHNHRHRHRSRRPPAAPPRDIAACSAQSNQPPLGPRPGST
jgi:hypothetical protein